MSSYIFITTEGYTYLPASESIEPNIENCQVIGFAKGNTEQQAFQNLTKENPHLLETSFDELICLELKYKDCFKCKRYFYLSNLRESLKY